MKIGIMTFHAASNHGAALQAYALQTQLEKMGHQPFFINYLFGEQPRKGVLAWIGRSPANTFEKVDKQFRYKPFLPFQKKYLHVGDVRYVSHEQLYAAPPEADMYICGSDQVWNPNLFSKEKDERAFWLDFNNNGVRRVAYAPSFGVTHLGNDTVRRYTAYAKHFDAISVREKNALHIMEKLGKQNAVWVPDPTLLIELNDFLNIEQQHQQSQKPYLFSYQLQTRRSLPSAATAINKTVCSCFGIELYDSYSVSVLHNIFRRKYLNPAQWLYKLHNSDFIVTNSFHGTVFALLYHRPFITILRKGLSTGMNNRIETLLEVVGLSNRSVTEFDQNHIEALCREKIEWSVVETKIKEFRETGIKFLKDALALCNRGE
ncbi:MAG: hypothetical protein A2X81_13885 [Desulfobacterales bacterium GWB2_56_26]|nr:MAG: hypothetical protein A2X81_13885 [Desulfobacterales bacterium GWB2_56_26]